MDKLSSRIAAALAALVMAAFAAGCGGGGGGATTAAPAGGDTTTPPTGGDTAPPSGGDAATNGMRDMTSLQLSKELSPGWNLGNTLEARGTDPVPWDANWTWETNRGNPKATQALMDAVKAAGFKFVRIPVQWSQYTDADNNINPKWMARVKEAVGYARTSGMYVMINIHWDGGWMNHPTYDQQPAINAKVTKFWTQIANAFKDEDDHLLFAAQNETGMEVPGNPTAEWLAVQNGINQTFVNAVRATGGNNAKRHLVLPAYFTHIDYARDFFVMPSDSVANRLSVEVHYYGPFSLTGDGKSPIWQWGATATDPAATESWANEAFVDGEFQKMKTRFVDKGVPVILGEYGAISKTEYDPAGKYRTLWTQYVTKSASSMGWCPSGGTTATTPTTASACSTSPPARRPSPSSSAPSSMPASRKTAAAPWTRRSFLQAAAVGAGDSRPFTRTRRGLGVRLPAGLAGATAVALRVRGAGQE